MTWTNDPDHVSIQFSAKHMLVATVRGHFNEYEVDAFIDEQELTNSRATFTIHAASLESRNRERDAHLRSADFLDVENHPVITFVSRSIEERGKNNFRIHGDLTIRGVTRPVSFDTEVHGPFVDPWGTERISLTANGKVNRKDFGLTWNMALEAGGVMVGEEVKLSLEAELVKVPEPALAAV
ncbi:MAG TPA: YceI family protein [Tepidiformaceae bacterium]|nr:YceI family protein [Tepidiformaceae bacterium]